MTSHEVPGSPGLPAPAGLPASRRRSAAQKRAAQSDLPEPRKAPAPGRLSWKDFLLRVYQQIEEDRVLAVAGGVVFFGLLAIFPAITALVSIYGLIATPSSIVDHLIFIANLMPGSAYEIIQEQITRIVERGGGKLSLTFAFGLGLALWSANAGMKAMMDALNVIHDKPETRGFVRLNLISLGLTASTLIGLLLAIGAVVVFPLVLGWFGLGNWTERVVSIVRWPALLLVIMSGLAVLYRIGPSCPPKGWRVLSYGTVFATVAWLCSSALLSWYLANFADYDATYGSLGAGIGLMMWLWLSVVVVLTGAEIDSVINEAADPGKLDGSRQ
ncbi:MAG: ribonuclease [Xanthobacteraceae bacterium]|jgi:membrane protein|nr:ribonuclease [Xanthobacteraceae bacterium]